MNTTTDKTEPLVMQLLATAGSLERGLDSVLSFSRGITFSEYRLLRALQGADQGLTRVALARALSVSPSGVTRALKPLEKLGYVVTVKSPRDARQSLARITKGGAELLADVSGVMNDFFVELAIEDTDAELFDAIQQLLRRLQRGS
jgi:DNA-binding MarR family transcriptional regulator